MRHEYDEFVDADRRFVGRRQGPSREELIGIDKGLGAFMGSVYAWMAGGLGISAAVAMWMGTQPELILAIFGSWLMWPVMIVPFILIIVLGSMMKGGDLKSPVVGSGVYLLITGVMGLWLSGIGQMAWEDPAYASLVGQSLLITVGMFAGMSITGWITKKDLSSMGIFFMAGLWGLIFAMIGNFWIASVQFDFWISVIAVVLFAGLTAYDTQKIKTLYREGGGGHGLAIMGALTLYLDFVNLFLHLLRIFGGNSSSSD